MEIPEQDLGSQYSSNKQAGIDVDNETWMQQRLEAIKSGQGNVSVPVPPIGEMALEKIRPPTAKGAPAEPLKQPAAQPPRSLLGNLLDDAINSPEPGETIRSIGTGWGPAEAAFNLATGIPAFITGGITQGIEAIYPGSTKNLPVETINEIAGKLIYEPKTAAGQQLISAISSPFTASRDLGNRFADWIREKTGSPLLATMGGAPVAALPELLMLLGIGKRALSKTEPLTPKNLTMPELDKTSAELFEKPPRNPLPEYYQKAGEGAAPAPGTPTPAPSIVQSALNILKSNKGEVSVAPEELEKAKETVMTVLHYAGEDHTIGDLVKLRGAATPAETNSYSKNIRERMAENVDYPDYPYIPQVNTYAAGNLQREAKVTTGKSVYAAQVKEAEIYDGNKDPLKLWDKAREITTARGQPGNTAAQANIFDNLVVQNGFRGSILKSGAGELTREVYLPGEVEAVPSKEFQMGVSKTVQGVSQKPTNLREAIDIADREAGDITSRIQELAKEIPEVKIISSEPTIYRGSESGGELEVSAAIIVEGPEPSVNALAARAGTRYGQKSMLVSPKDPKEANGAFVQFRLTGDPDAIETKALTSQVPGLNIVKRADGLYVNHFVFGEDPAEIAALKNLYKAAGEGKIEFNPADSRFYEEAGYKQHVLDYYGTEGERIHGEDVKAGQQYVESLRANREAVRGRGPGGGGQAGQELQANLQPTQEFGGKVTETGLPKTKIGEAGFVSPPTWEEIKEAYKRGQDLIDFKRVKKSGVYVGAPTHLKIDTPEKLNAWAADLYRYASEGVAAKDWYEQSAQKILQFVGGDKERARKFVEQVAILSPQTDVAMNLEYAVNAFYHLERGLPFKAGLYPKMVEEAIGAFERGEPVTGLKRSNFYQNLMHAIDPENFPKGPATIDSWMQRAGKYQLKSFLKPTQGQFMEKVVQKIALDMGLDPEQVQASIWSAYKARYEMAFDHLDEAAIERGMTRSTLANPNPKYDAFIKDNLEKVANSYSSREIYEHVKKSGEDFASRLVGAGFMPSELEFGKVDPGQFLQGRYKSDLLSIPRDFTSEELSNVRLYKDPGYDIGYSIDSEGNLSNVFDNSGIKGSFDEAILSAIFNGARKVEFPDGHLTRAYKRLGFKIKGRRGYEEEYAAEGLGTTDILTAEYDGPTPGVDYGAFRRKVLGPAIPWHPKGAFGTAEGLERVPGRSYERPGVGEAQPGAAIEGGGPLGQVLTIPGQSTLRPLGQIARDLKTIIEFDERGSISGEALSPEKLAAYNRLKGDIKVIARNAQRTGKTIEQYLTDLKVDPEVISYLTSKMGEVNQQKTGTAPTAPPIPAPDIRVNLDRIANTESVKSVIADINEQMQTAGRIEQTTRGVRGHEKTIAASMTEKGRMTVEDILTRKPGEIWNAEQITSVRDIRDAVAVNIKRLSDRALTGDQQAVNDLPAALALFGEIEAQRTGASAEIGRALESHKILSEAGRQPYDISDLAYLAQAVKDAAGDPVVLARRIRALEKPEQLQTFGRQLVQGLKMGRDIFNFAWINGLLSGPPTHVVNFISNAITGVGGIAERALASRIGQVKEVFGLDAGVKVGESSAMMHGIINGFMDALKEAKASWMENEPRFGGAKTEKIVRNPLSQEYLETTGAFGRTLEFLGEIIGGPGRALMTSDEFWKGINYRAELQARAFREGTSEGLVGKALADRINHIVENPEEFSSIHEAAQEYALYQTFNSELGKVGRGVMTIANATPLTKLALPFVRTPTNILKYSAERTPGLNLISQKFWNDISLGGASQEAALAKISLGVMTTATILYLADAGYITGSGPSEKKTRNIWLQDHQPYSFKVGDTWIAYDRMDPWANVVGVVADTANMTRDLELDTGYQIFSAAALSMSNMMVNKTYLKGLADLLDAVKSPDKGAEDYIRQWAKSLTPSAVKVMNRAFFDPTVREVNGIFEAIQSGIPGYSKDLPPKRGFWGQPVVFEGSLGPDMLSPYRTKQQTGDPVNEEIIANRMSLSMPSKVIGGTRPSENILAQNQPRLSWGIKMTPEEYDRYVVLARSEVKVGGKNLHDKLADMIQTDSYQRQSPGPDGGRALLFRAWISQFDTVAQAQLLKEFPELAKAIRDQQLERAQALRPMP